MSLSDIMEGVWVVNEKVYIFWRAMRWVDGVEYEERKRVCMIIREKRDMAH